MVQTGNELLWNTFNLFQLLHFSRHFSHIPNNGYIYLWTVIPAVFISRDNVLQIAILKDSTTRNTSE
jgi:hypothetical protein